jgi:hypothetical protein
MWDMAASRSQPWPSGCKRLYLTRSIQFLPVTNRTKGLVKGEFVLTLSGCFSLTYRTDSLFGSFSPSQSPRLKKNDRL